MAIAVAAQCLSAAEPSPNLHRHPLVSAIDKDAYNAWTELQSALANGANDDACRIVTSLNESALRGLLPDAEDRDLFVSFPVMIEQIVESHPSFSRTLIEKFEPQGLIRVRAAIDRRDELGLKIAIEQFPRTEAARLGHTWMGDNSLAVGRLRDAEHHFQQALIDGKPSHRDELTCKLRLAQALGGRLSNVQRPGQSLPKGQKINMNGISVSQGDFDAMIAELTAHQNADDREEPSASSLEFPFRNHSLVRQAELELSNLAQARPLFVREQLLVAPRINSTRQIVCLNSSDGRIVWIKSPAGSLLTDPLIWNQRIVVVTLTKLEDEQFQINALRIDRASGDVEFTLPLFQSREAAESAILVADDWHAVLIADGTVCCFTWDGNVKWIRRINPTQKTNLEQYKAERTSLKLDSNGTAILMLEESNEIQCVGLASGRTKWRQTVPGIRRLLAVSESRIVLESTDGLVALEADSGQTAWKSAAIERTESAIDDGKTMIVRSAFNNDRNPADLLKRQLTWIDLRSGEDKGKSILELPNVEQPRLGRFFPGRGQWWVTLDHSKGSTLFEVQRTASSE